MTSLPIIRSSHEAQAFIISPAANSRVYPTSGLIRGTEIDVTTTSSSSSSFEIGVSSSSSSLTPQNISCSQLLNDSNQMSEQSILLEDAEHNIVEVRSAEESYRRGLVTIGFITLLFASNSPVLHSSFSMTTNTPPVLLINSAVSMVGLIGVVVASPLLSRFVPDPSKEYKTNDNSVMSPSALAGVELGLWKTLGTTANIWGLSQTSSDHGAFLIQLTTLIVPLVQGITGVPIPTQIWTAISLALAGVFMFTQDPNQADSASLQGDLMCIFAAVFYATYDLRLFKWGKIVPTDELITTKMVTQSLLSLAMLSVLGREETLLFVSQASHRDLELVGVVALWSGLAVNCVAPYLQVSGQQAVGPARAQILYASQPLWAAIMSYFLLGERCGIQGLVGGSAFLGAMFLAATADLPDPNCPAEECEV